MSQKCGFFPESRRQPSYTNGVESVVLEKACFCDYHTFEKNVTKKSTLLEELHIKCAEVHARHAHTGVSVPRVRQGLQRNACASIVLIKGANMCPITHHANRIRQHCSLYGFAGRNRSCACCHFPIYSGEVEESSQDEGRGLGTTCQLY